MSKEIVFLNGERHVANQCGTCAVWHTIPEIVFNSCRSEGGYWHCPNGHQRGFRKGTDEIDRENTRRERDQLKQEAARLQDEIAAERKRADETEKKLLLVKRRANAGVCQCCNRTFLNVQRHMKSKHPNVVPLENKFKATSA